MRYIGIISDGETDYQVFKKIVETILSNEVQVFWLSRQKLHDDIEKYWKHGKKTGNDKKSEPCNSSQKVEIRKAVTGILNQALDDFRSKMGGNNYLTCKDMILLTTDAEKLLARLNNEPDYWECNGDYFGILHCLMNAIRAFCATQYQQYLPPESLPMIIPMVTFPSIEPFLLIAKGEKLANINGKKPDELKKCLYKTDNPSGEEIEQAIEKIKDDQVYKILKNLPESRFFIQFLLMLKPA
jgi:hypothetical protein